MQRILNKETSMIQNKFTIIGKKLEEFEFDLAEIGDDKSGVITIIDNIMSLLKNLVIFKSISDNQIIQNLQYLMEQPIVELAKKKSKCLRLSSNYDNGRELLLTVANCQMDLEKFTIQKYKCIANDLIILVESFIEDIEEL